MSPFFVFKHGCFQKWGEHPQNGWFIMEISIRMDNLGVPIFLENLYSKLSKPYKGKDPLPTSVEKNFRFAQVGSVDINRY